MTEVTRKFVGIVTREGFSSPHEQHGLLFLELRKEKHPTLGEVYVQYDLCMNMPHKVWKLEEVEPLYSEVVIVTPDPKPNDIPGNCEGNWEQENGVCAICSIWIRCKETTKVLKKKGRRR